MNNSNIKILYFLQVSSVIQDDNSTCSNRLVVIPVPALGLAWANLVTTRLQMIRTNDKDRELSVIFAPDLPKTSCPYKITQNGIMGI